MKSSDWQQIESILDDVLQLPESEWDMYVDQECGDNVELKGEVTELLESISASEGWLESPGVFKRDLLNEISNEIDLLSSDRSLIGQQIGSYTIRRKIGQGGMGSVFLAERTDGKFEHQVAIKIIRHGFANSENIRRFKREQGILAGMNHPGIARLFDGGVTSDGFPYIIMEYVDGLSITHYCQQNNCSINDKINLFIQILEAVRHAHENLVIHRDLKPDNILITKSGKVKILDFGISKLLEEEDSEIITQTGSKILTLRYAAPEQIKQTNITTSTDLYSLGMVFYELFANTGPFDFTEKSKYEIEQCIINENPQKPSKKTDSEKLRTSLTGDLDAIALKSIRKETDQRYRVANEFLDDLKNYKNNLPVSARVDSFSYRTNKFFHRHHKSIAVASIILAMLIGVTVFYTWRISQERDIAQQEAERAEEVTDFILSIFDSTNPALAQGSVKDLTASKLLNTGITKIETELNDRPSIYIDLMVSVGDALGNLTNYDTAKEAFEKALDKSKNYYGDNSLETANVYQSLGELYQLERKTDSARVFIEKSIAIINNSAEYDPFELANSYSILAFTSAIEGNYDHSREYHLKADSLYLLSNSKETVARYNNLTNLSETEIRLEHYDLAEDHLIDALTFYKQYHNGPHINIASTLSKLGSYYSVIGKYETANNYFYEALEIKKNLIGENSSSVSNTYGELALNYWELRKLDDALFYINKNISLVEDIYGVDSYNYAIALSNLALIQETAGNYQSAMESYKKSIAVKERLFEPTHTSLAISYYNYGSFLSKYEMFNEAIDYLDKAITIDKKALGEESVGVAIDYNRLATILMESGNLNKADNYFNQAREIFLAKLPENHKRIGENLEEHGKLYLRKNNYEIASNKLNEALNVYETIYETGDPRISDLTALLKEINSYN